MLPCQSSTWPKGVARAIILFALIAAVATAYYLHDQHLLYIPEITILLLLLLAILPPNIAILRRKPDAQSTSNTLNPNHSHHHAS